MFSFIIHYYQMEQKRKVKNLISCDRDGSFLTIVLLAIWMLFCFWSLWLMSVSFVWAADNVYTYSSWIDDKSEVVYRLELMDWEGDVKSSFYIDWSGLQVYSVPWIVTGHDHEINANLYSNILWWEWNKIYSNNITILGGKDVYVSENNDNAAILWWETNSMYLWIGEPSLLVWGKENVIEPHHNWVGIIWWRLNIIKDWSENSFIIWWEWNDIKWYNVIVWWEGVTVDWLDNVFVFSDSAFTPETSGAFYLNVSSWVWINTVSMEKWLEISGAIALGVIEDDQKCDSNSLGLMWFLEIGEYKCLVWCTEVSAIDGKWELFDRGSKCSAQCWLSDDCLDAEPVEIENDSYASYCLDNVDTGNAVMCFPLVDNYENVVFESSLLDSDEECPEMRENKCIFRCKPNYHLTWNIAGNDQSNLHCYVDCELPWNKNIRIAQNETVEAYNVWQVYCSNNAYVFPKDTTIINFPIVWYIVNDYKKIKDWTAYESCTNDDHKKTLVCNEGVLYLAEADGKTASNKKAEDYWYTGWSCSLSYYRCPTEYSLSEDYITNVLKDPVGAAWWRNHVDRKITEWVRWRYEVCVDWDADEWNESCSIPSGNNSYHYKFIGCQDGFIRDSSDNICKAQCAINWKWVIGWSVSRWKTINHNSVWVWYSKERVFCPETCSNVSATYTCRDGRLFDENDNKVFVTTVNIRHPEYSELLFGEPATKVYNYYSNNWDGFERPVGGTRIFIWWNSWVTAPSERTTNYDFNIVYSGTVATIDECDTRDNSCFYRTGYDAYTNTGGNRFYHTNIETCNIERWHEIYYWSAYWTNSDVGKWICKSNGDQEFRTTSCDPWYHMNYEGEFHEDNDVCVSDEQRKYCPPKPDYSEWIWKAAEVHDYYGWWGIWRYDAKDDDGHWIIGWGNFTYDNNGNAISQGLTNWTYVDHWQWTWNSCRINKNKCYQSWKWPQDDDCQWKCIEGGDPNSTYDDFEVYPEGSHNCRKNGVCSKTEVKCLDGWVPQNKQYDDDRGVTWECKGIWVWSTTDSCHLCNDGYSWDEDKQRCVRNLDGECDESEPYGCVAKDLYNRTLRNTFPISDYLHKWECRWSWSWEVAYCHKCFENYEYDEETDTCVPMTRTAYCETGDNIVWVDGDGTYPQSWIGDWTDGWWDVDWLGDGWYWDPAYETVFYEDGEWWLCDFDCIYGYELVDGVCKPITYWSCGRYPKHYQCKAWTGDENDQHEETRWWEWSCKWTPSWGDASCIECRAWYRLEGDECVESICNHCAISGFPYCFPIDFNNECHETDWWWYINTDCDPKYYWDVDEWQCKECGIWRWSNGTMTECEECTNKPENAHWTGNWSSNDCGRTCDEGYYKDGNQCVAINCDPKYYWNSTAWQCIACSNWTRSAGGYLTLCWECKGKHVYGDWTSNWSSENGCTWRCRDGYMLNDSNQCVTCQGWFCVGGERYSCSPYEWNGANGQSTFDAACQEPEEYYNVYVEAKANYSLFWGYLYLGVESFYPSQVVPLDDGRWHHVRMMFENVPKSLLYNYYLGARLNVDATTTVGIISCEIPPSYLGVYNSPFDWNLFLWGWDEWWTYYGWSCGITNYW